MDKIKLKNYRCFKDEQKARLAPLTILVGENSAGKSSFLAMVRALWDLYYNHQAPNFNEDPFDFGTFDNIIYSGCSSDEISETFDAGFKLKNGWGKSDEYLPIWFEVKFGKRRTAPFPNKLRVFNKKRELKFAISAVDDNLTQVEIQTKRGRWKSKEISGFIRLFKGNRLTPFPFVLANIVPTELDSNNGMLRDTGIEYTSVSNQDSVQISEDDWYQIGELLEATFPMILRYFPETHLPYASSPVRSKPIRTYNPKLFTWDPEGNYAPMYLAHLFDTERGRWDELKTKLEEFGSHSGLFDEISIRKLEDHDGAPFHVEIRKFSKHDKDKERKGKKRNLIDVGYGVSQILPVVIELLRNNPTPLLLLQQPEVHLHPSAQAALGSLLLKTARKEQVVIVESHSDHLLNRIRMDLRDQVSDCKPEDVSILYFENSNLESTIYSLRIDEQGNVLDAPQSYGRFFMAETKRSLRL